MLTQPVDVEARPCNELFLSVMRFVCRYLLAVDWSMVSDHLARMRRSDRLLLDQDCLQWTPPVHSDEDDDDDDTINSQVL